MTNLQLLRRQRQMSQKDLAKKLGIAVVDVSRLENRWYTRAPKRVDKLLKSLFGPGWTFETLMQEVAEPTPPALEQPPGDSEADELRKAS